MLPWLLPSWFTWYWWTARRGMSGFWRTSSSTKMIPWGGQGQYHHFRQELRVRKFQQSSVVGGRGVIWMHLRLPQSLRASRQILCFRRKSTFLKDLGLRVSWAMTSKRSPKGHTCTILHLCKTQSLRKAVGLISLEMRIKEVLSFNNNKKDFYVEFLYESHFFKNLDCFY